MPSQVYIEEVYSKNSKYKLVDLRGFSANNFVQIGHANTMFHVAQSHYGNAVMIESETGTPFIVNHQGVLEEATIASTVRMPSGITKLLTVWSIAPNNAITADTTLYSYTRGQDVSLGTKLYVDVSLTFDKLDADATATADLVFTGDHISDKVFAQSIGMVAQNGRQYLTGIALTSEITSVPSSLNIEIKNFTNNPQFSLISGTVSVSEVF